MAASAVSAARKADTGLDLSLSTVVVLILLFTLLYSAASGIARAVEGPAWEPLWQAVLLASLLGWSGGALGVRPLRLVPATVLAGLGFALISGGRLAGPLGAVAGESAQLAVQVITARRLSALDASALMVETHELSQALAVVSERVSTWIAGWRAGANVFDPVAASILWAFLLWLVAAWAGWWIGARNRPVVAVAPASLLTIVALTYTGARYEGLYLMLGSGLLLIATVHHDERRSVWRREGIRIPPRLGWEIGKRALTASAGIVLLTAIIPSVSMQQVRDWLRSDGGAGAEPGSGLGEPLGLERQEAEDPLEDLRRPGLPRGHLIGAGPELSEQVVMRVEVAELDADTLELESLPLYWRSVTYDIYTGRSWRSSGTSPEVYAARSLTRENSAPHSIALGQRVERLGPAPPALHAAGEIVSVDRDYSIEKRSPGDVFAVTARAGGEYQVVSSLAVPDSAALRAAGELYPEWVVQRHLQLPNDLPGRIRNLTLELTATEGTPYDRVRAIESYLRQIPYTLDVDRAPLARDVVDFFLFDERRGYCDYYASAMAVLSRAAGVPARVAVGYARGTFDLDQGVYLVTEAEAHSWVEVYFPGVGWVAFEPTAARPALDRSRSHERDLGSLHDSNVFFSANDAARRRSALPYVLATLAGIGGLGALWVVADEVKLGRLPPMAASAETHRRLRRLAESLLSGVEPGATPTELLHLLETELIDRATTSAAPAGLARRFHRDVAALTAWISLVQFEPEVTGKQGGARAPARWWMVWANGHALKLAMRLRDRYERIRTAWTRYPREEGR